MSPEHDAKAVANKSSYKVCRELRSLAYEVHREKANEFGTTVIEQLVISTQMDDGLNSLRGRYIG